MRVPAWALVFHQSCACLLTQETQRVLIHLLVLHQAIIEAFGLPCLRKVHDGDCLPESVHLQAGGSHSRHDGCIVDDLSLHSHGASPKEQVGVRGGSAQSSPTPQKEKKE